MPSLPTVCMSAHGTASSACVAAAVPFEEDERDPSIWFLDHSYLENMAAMYKKVNGAWQAHQCDTMSPEQQLSQERRLQ